MDLGPVDDTVTLRHDMRDPAGGILLAVLGIASPEGGGMSDLEAVPNPVIHSCQILDPGHDVRQIEVISETLKRGRQMGYSRSRIVDADHPERVLALTEGQGISLGAPPEGLEKMEVEPIVLDDSPDLPPLWQVFGGRRRDDGRWALPELAVELASPDAALAHRAAVRGPRDRRPRPRRRCRRHRPARGRRRSHVMFLARGKTGPFRVEGEATVGTDGAVAVRTLLHDEGADDRVITSGSYLFRSLG